MERKFKKMGRRTPTYIITDFLKEYKLYKQLLKVSDPAYEIVFSGYCYLKEINKTEDKIDFEKLSKEIAHDKIEINQKCLENINSKIPSEIIELGLFFIETYNLTYKDINNFYYTKELKELFYKRFLEKLENSNYKEFYSNRTFEISKDFNINSKYGAPKKQHEVLSYFKDNKISLTYFSEIKENYPDLLEILKIGHAYKIEKEKGIINFEELKSLLKREDNTDNLNSLPFHKKAEKETIYEGIECLKKYNLTDQDFNEFYKVREYLESTFRLLLKEIEDENWRQFIINEAKRERV